MFVQSSRQVFSFFHSSIVSSPQSLNIVQLLVTPGAYTLWWSFLQWGRYMAKARKTSSTNVAGKDATQRSRKSSAKKASSAKPSLTKYILWALLLLAVVSIIIFGAVWYYLSTHRSTDGIVVIVNDRPITQEQLNLQYGLLPQEYRNSFTKEQVLEQIIDEEVVVQAAERFGIIVTPEDINVRVQKIIADSGMTITDLQENLAHFNVTQELFEQLIARQMMIDRYLNKTLVVPPIDDATLQATYQADAARFTIGEQATVRHILISSQRDEAALLAKRLYDETRAGADFCVYAKNYSDDRGSRDTCGEYTFPRGFMVPEFEKAAFDMKDGEYRLIQTQFGYHIMTRLNVTASHMIPFADVRDQLLADETSTQRTLEYRAMVDQLRAVASIRYADGKTIMPSSPPAVGLPPKDDVAPVEIVPEETAPVEPVAPATPSVETAPVVPAAPAAPPVVAAPSAPVEELPQEPVAAPIDSKELFTCIAAKSKLYGASWESSTLETVAMFDKAGVKLAVVYCDEDKEACDARSVKAYPTWMISGKEYLGRMSIEQLKTATGC